MNSRSLLRAAVGVALLVLAACRQEPAPQPATVRPEPQAERGTAPAPPPSTSWHEARLTASDGAPFDHLGFSVAASGDVVVAGARFADGAGVDSGAAYVFRRGSGGWREEAKLAAADAVEHDRFGNAVGIDGDTLVVGAHAHHELGRKTGSAYVFRFRRGVWRQEARLAVPGSLRFGHAVAVSGDRVVVGAPGDRVGDLDAGVAYVFHRQGSTWRQEARLVAVDADAGDLFGQAVGLSGDAAVVGASGDDEQGSLTGAAYVFRREGGGWRQEAKLLAEDAAALAELGKAVAIDGETAVVGAEGMGDVGKFAGAAYVFRRGTGGWQQETKLLAADRKPADRFGNAVAVHLDTVAVGAHFADDAGLGSGSAYLFRRAGGRWQQQAKLLSSDGEAGAELGNAVAVHGSTVAVGALRGGTRGPAAGAVSVFEPAAGLAQPGGQP